MKITLERYFYPVGQGLCCHERIHGFNLVYDCGSRIQEQPDKDICESVKSFFDGNEIDVLILSHFHYDHTNMLDVLIDAKIKIKKIIIPYIDKAEYNILRYIDGNCNIKLLNSALEERGYQDIDVIHLKEDFQSLEDLNLLPDVLKSFWKYEIYNYQYITKSKEFKDKVIKEKLDYGQLSDPVYVSTNNKKLKDIYESIGGLNEQSSVLFSYPKEANRYCTYTSYKICRPKKNGLRDCFFVKNTDERCRFSNNCDAKIAPGCIFFGDYPVKYTRKFDQISENVKKLLSEYVIGTIQFPHHGSSTGLNEKIIRSEMEYIFSFGIGNIYRHPNKNAVQSVVYKGNCPVFVTDYCGYKQMF